mmetsp:Transcript_13419/g.15068  ORF Transcript_13419/g.15068 Transcript_13419/m.15068 type:complete len:163 (-) Transcript_13419:38-526(-)
MRLLCVVLLLVKSQAWPGMYYGCQPEIDERVMGAPVQLGVEGGECAILLQQNGANVQSYRPGAVYDLVVEMSNNYHEDKIGGALVSGSAGQLDGPGKSRDSSCPDGTARSFYSEGAPQEPTVFQWTAPVSGGAVKFVSTCTGGYMGPTFQGTLDVEQEDKDL